MSAATDFESTDKTAVKKLYGESKREKLRELGFRVFVLDALEDIPRLLQTIAEGGDAQ